MIAAETDNWVDAANKTLAHAVTEINRRLPSHVYDEESIRFDDALGIFSVTKKNLTEELRVSILQDRVIVAPFAEPVGGFKFEVVGGPERRQSMLEYALTQFIR